MLVVNETCKEWFEQTVEFAKRIHLYEAGPPEIKVERLWSAKDKDAIIDVVRILSADEKEVVFKPLARLVVPQPSTLRAEDHLPTEVRLTVEAFREVYEPRHAGNDDKEYLKRSLDFLGGYACPEGTNKLTRCTLFKDHAPASFSFHMARYSRKRECRDCGHKWTSPVVHSAHTPNISGEETVFCPKCESRGCSSAPAEYEHWFSGGLLYHGSHDGWGSGAGPVFSVTLTPCTGWAIHT